MFHWFVIMEEEVGDTSLPDVIQSSCSSATVTKHEGCEPTVMTTSCVDRRKSLGDFSEVRRRDVVQFRGLAVPSPSVDSGDGTTLSARCSLPTIVAAKPQSKLLSTSSQRRGSSGYQSVLTGLPFITSTSSRSSTSGTRRRSSLLPCQPSDSMSGSVLESYGMYRHVNNNSKHVDVDEIHLEHHPSDEVHKAKSKTNINSIGTSNVVPSLPSPHDQDDDQPLSYAVDHVSSSAGRRDVSEDSTTKESLEVNSLKCEEPTDNVVDEAAGAWQDSGPVDYSVISPIMALQSISLNDSDGRLPADDREDTTNASPAGGSATDVNSCWNWSWSSGQPRSHNNRRDFAKTESIPSQYCGATRASDSSNLKNIVIDKDNVELGAASLEVETQPRRC